MAIHRWGEVLSHLNKVKWLLLRISVAYIIVTRAARRERCFCLQLLVMPTGIATCLR